ncbi:hypothetical protein [Marinivivus vitaminiproducens]|uniref:hypothetical protein n=1 Tax=Marinivivus vitaminiproducens TaxID=3035935 RepID=UPI00279EB078|nr:hypothetical protein P4R82_19780 [Geminicoccaceae bacterium SCSIO 64248]
MAENDKRATGCDPQSWQAGKGKLTVDGAGSWIYVDDARTPGKPAEAAPAEQGGRR